VVLALLVVGTACGSGTKSEAAQAQDALARGLKAHRAGNVVEATKDYHEVLAHDPNNKFAYYNLGLIDQLASRAIEAEANYRSALKIDPDFTAALFNLAILRTNPAPQEALALYRHVLAVKADDAAAHLNL